MWPVIIVLALIVVIPAILYNSLVGKRNQVKNIFAPETKSERKMIDGTPEEQVDNLVNELRGIKCL